ncbi:MAG: aminoacyl-tRNA hydrolase [Candidatus Babeliales bacterium]
MEFKKENIKAIVGLGNPGQKYYKNRHNIGFRIVDEIANRLNLSWLKKDNLEYAKNSFYLIKPQTFMNNSGQALNFLLKKGISAEQILVVHDELEKKFGDVVLKFGGSAKGHNGLRSIINVIGTDFYRLNFGVGRPQDKDQVSNYVLSNFNSEEESQIEFFINKVVDLILNS